MTITLYKNSAEKNRVDKTNYLTNSRTLTGTLREECDILTPVIIIQSQDFPNYNYCYISEFHRYYFIEGIVSVNTNMWEISMSIDVLMTYRNAIYDLEVFVDRNENFFDEEIIDTKRIIKQGVNVETFQIQTNFENGSFFNTDNPKMVLSGFSVKVGDN